MKRLYPFWTLPKIRIDLQNLFLNLLTYLHQELEERGMNPPFTDLTSNQFIEGMRKIFELEPFIKIHSMSTTSILGSLRPRGQLGRPKTVLA